MSGLPVPSFTTPNNILVALDDDSDESELLEYGEVLDQVPLDTTNNPVDSIVVNKFVRGSSTWIVKNDYDLGFIPTTTVPA